MRNVRLTMTSSSLALALGALLATPAAAQNETAQADAQQINDQQECSTIADPAARQSCLDTQGETALPESGAASGEEIVVTGSRISRPNFETIQPSVVIDSAQIESRGFETLGQALNEQPSFGVPGSSPIGNAQGGSFGSGQSFVNFLGLGDQRTLTLVNGRRFVSSNTSSIFGPTSAGTQVDLNAINTKLVDRVETIAIGGAPIYGSDAIAGTVNVILKRDYQGVDLDAQYGISSRGDAPNYRLRALAGHNFLDGRLNVTVSGEMNVGKGLLYNDRSLLRQGRFEDICAPDQPFDSCLYYNRRIPSISENGIPSVGGEPFGLNFPLSPAQAALFGLGDYGIDNFGVLDPTGNQLIFDANGNLIPLDFGTPVGGPDDFSTNFSGGNGFDINRTSQLLTDTRRYNLNLLTSFDVTDNIRFFTEGWFARSKGTNLRAQPVYNSGLFDSAGTADGPIILSIDNPFLSAAQRTAIQNSITNNPGSDQNVYCNLLDDCFVQDYFYLSRANTDLASGRATSTTNLYRGVAGLDGKFNVGGRRWGWELTANYGRSTVKGKEKTVVQQNFENAVDAIVGPNGDIICRPGYANAPIATGTATCTPLNLFGQGQISQAALDYVLADANPKVTNQQFVATGSVNGGLFSLPGGDFSAALGFEYRKETTNFQPGDFYFGGPDTDPLTDSDLDGDPTNDREQFGRSIPILPVKGGYNTKEAFGEIRAPLIGPSNSVPGIYNLELHGAARYVDHSTAGSDWTYTLEGRWDVIRDVAFRGNYTRAIRAPAITEIFNPSSSFFGFATDPCDRRNTSSGPNPTARAANCLAAGVPTTFNSLSNQRSFGQAIAGNPDLSNEKSKAFSVGTVLRPRFIRNLTISADYLDIRLKDAITSFSATQVVNACYDSSDFPNNAFCPLVVRDEDAQLSYVQTRYFNAAEYRYRGVLGSLDYRTKTPFLGASSSIGVNASYQYLRTLTQTSDENSPASTINGSIGYPKHSAVLNLNYDNENFGLFTSFNYTGKVKVDPDAAPGDYQYPTRDAVVFVNAGMNFDIAKRFTLRFVVDNLLDTKPPFPTGGSISYFPGVLGRYFRAGASVRF